MYRCNGGTSIHQNQVCDGTPDCEAGHDESACEMANCPSQCHCELLYMRCYKLTGFLFLSLNMYKVLEISGELSLFKQLLHFNNLIMLNASYNNISSIALSREASFISLHYLDVSFNRFRVLTQDMFKLFPNLRQIWLIGNNIKLIQQGAFSNLRLQNLDLSGLFIQHIESGAFKALELHHLDISSNNITTIEMAYFYQSISSVNIKGNPLTTLVILENVQVRLNAAHEYLCCLREMFICKEGWKLDSVCPVDAAVAILSDICGGFVSVLNVVAGAWVWLQIKERGSVIIGYMWVIICDGLLGICLFFSGMKEILFPITYIQISHSTKHLLCLFIAGMQISLLFMILMGRLVVAYTLYTSTKLIRGIGIHKFLWCIPLSAIFSLTMGITPALVSLVFIEQPVDVTNLCSHLLPVCHQLSLSVNTLVIFLINIAFSLAELIILSTVLTRVSNSAKSIKSMGGRIHSRGSSIKKVIIKKLIRCIISIFTLTPAVCLTILHLNGCYDNFVSMHIKFILLVIPFLPSLLNPILIFIH